MRKIQGMDMPALSCASFGNYDRKQKEFGRRGKNRRRTDSFDFLSHHGHAAISQGIPKGIPLWPYGCFTRYHF